MNDKKADALINTLRAIQKDLHWLWAVQSFALGALVAYVALK